MTARTSPLQLSTQNRLNSKERQLINKALRDWLECPDVEKVSVTLLANPYANLSNGPRIQLNIQEFSDAVYLLIKKLSRIQFSTNQVERGARLKHIFRSECGTKSGLHYHGYIEVPANLTKEQFRDRIETYWKSLEFGDEADINERCDGGWIDYVLKHQSTGETIDHIDLRNFRLN